MKLYKCETCGNIFEVIKDAAIVPVCCGSCMKQIIVNEDEVASKEKHIAIYTKDNNEVNIQVGSIMHPNTTEHHIEWIALVTDKNRYTHYLKDSDPPVTTFYLSDDNEKVVSIYAYCNLHGLWLKKGRDIHAE